MAITCSLLGNPVAYDVLVTGPEKKHSQGNDKREGTFTFLCYKPKSFIDKMKQTTNTALRQICRSSDQTLHVILNWSKDLRSTRWSLLQFTDLLSVSYYLQGLVQCLAHLSIWYMTKARTLMASEHLNRINQKSERLGNQVG